MRFNKRTRKIRVRKKKQQTGSRIPYFVFYLVGGLALLGLFYLILYQGHLGQMDRVRNEKIREDMDVICSALASFRRDHGRYPMAGEGLERLLGARENRAGAEPAPEAGEYLERIPPDPWGSPYVYEHLPEKESFSLSCWGADRKPGGEAEASDIVREGCRDSGMQAG